MATTLTIDLSQQMQGWLATGGGAGNGVSAYAILYGGATADDATDTPLDHRTLFSDGTVQTDGTVTLDLTTADQPHLYGGKVYIIIQSLDDPARAIDPATLQQSDITWAHAADHGYRYDSIEISLTGSSGDAANLTSIEGFGIGMSLAASTGARGYAVTASDIFGQLQTAPTHQHQDKPALTTFDAGGLAGQTRQAVSPAIAVVGDNHYPLYAASDWDAYIDALKHTHAPIIVNGYFNGAGDLQAGAPEGTPVIWRNAGFFSYRLEWREAQHTFWLIPTEGSEIQGAIRLEPGAFADSVYSTLGTVRIFNDPAAQEAYDVYPDSKDMNAGANNAWGQALQQLTLGLTAGYLQSRGISPNDAIAETVDLNRNYNWSPIYAYGIGNNTNSLLPGEVEVTSDPYSQIFFSNSNSYGTQYADALMAAYLQGGPLLPVYAGGANVQSLTLTLYADQETPPPGTYTPPLIQDFVAATAPDGHYAVAEWQDGNGASIALDFNPGDSAGQSLVLREDVRLTFRILTGYDGHRPVWQDVPIGGAQDSPWQVWTFHNDGGTYSVTGNGGAGQTDRSLVLSGPPMAGSGTGWYQLLVAGPGFEKVFNLYTTTFTPAPTTGDPNPTPLFSDFTADPSLFGIDGNATLTPGAGGAAGGLLTFSVGVTGVTPTLDLVLMRANTDAAFRAGQVLATAPVVGRLHGDDFAAIAGQDSDVHAAGGGGTALAFTSGGGRLAFGWTGLNHAADTADWTETFTNLVRARSIAVLDIAQQGGDDRSIAPVHGVADLRGAWHSAATQLGNGTYDVTMTAYLPKPHAPYAPDMNAPLTRESASLTLTVQIADLDLRAVPGGLALVADDAGTEGNWIHLRAGAGTLPQGRAIALYATDAEGRPLDASGLPAASLADAVLGWVGAVGTDRGAMLLDGSQSIYLPTGQHLRFGHADAGGGITPAGTVTSRANADGSFTLGLDGLALDATIGNTLSAQMQSASLQRLYGLPMLHLDNGQQVELTLSGSADNHNTLRFLRLDLDQATGALSLDGLAYGGSEAFRAAALAAADGGFRATLGGGDFAQARLWTVAGEAGTYVPILLSESGELFLPGTANRDGRDHIRTFGANTFGFEDLSAAQGGDFDYNDLVVMLRPLSDPVTL